MPEFDKIATGHAKKAFSFAREFRDFAFKGNVVDLAVGVIIGTAFAHLIDSLVKSVIMPLVALLIPGGQGYVGWTATINGKDIPFGQFLGELVNFLIVALALFIFVVKFIGWMNRLRREEGPTATPPMTKDQELLTEIRDLLRQTQPRPAP